MDGAPGEASGRGLPAAISHGPTPKPRDFQGAAPRAAARCACHVVARSSLDTKIPRGETLAMAGTRHEPARRPAQPLGPSPNPSTGSSRQSIAPRPASASNAFAREKHRHPRNNRADNGDGCAASITA